MRRFINPFFIFLLVPCLGIQGVFAQTQEIEPKASPLTVYHIPPVPVFLGETLSIRLTVESDSEIQTVRVWYRAPGEVRYRRASMKKVSEGIYAYRILVEENFRKGIEYYFQVEDRMDNQVTQGTPQKPYYLQVRLPRPIPGLTLAGEGPKPWWKSYWFWGAMAIALGGGIAAAVASGGGGDNQPGEATIQVE